MRRNYLAVLLIASLCVIATPAQSDVVSADTKMSLVKTITGDISPKSVRSSGNGLVSAHNMMYVTMNLSGKVASWDLVNNKAGKSVKTGKAARSLAISSDGTALFVVNFVSDTMSKVRTSDMKVLQNIKVCNEPIGITYDSPTSRTWVACYGGSVKIFDNK